MPRQLEHMQAHKRLVAERLGRPLMFDFQTFTKLTSNTKIHYFDTYYLMKYMLSSS